MNPQTLKKLSSILLKEKILRNINKAIEESK